MNEKRKFARLNAGIDTQWKKIINPNKQLGIFNSSIKNISISGISIFTSQFLSKDTCLLLTIKLPQKTIRDIKGIVRWANKFEICGGINEFKYEAGIEFTGISDDDRKLINKFIFSLTGKKI